MIGTDKHPLYSSPACRFRRPVLDTLIWIKCSSVSVGTRRSAHPHLMPRHLLLLHTARSPSVFCVPSNSPTRHPFSCPQSITNSLSSTLKLLLTSLTCVPVGPADGGGGCPRIKQDQSSSPLPHLLLPLQDKLFFFWKVFFFIIIIVVVVIWKMIFTEQLLKRRHQADSYLVYICHVLFCVSSRSHHNPTCL